MNTGEQSLRQLIEKWFAPTPSMPARVTQFGRMRESRQRFLRVESLHQSGPFTIFFFQHDDGSWCVFPPCGERPAISYQARDVSTIPFNARSAQRAA
jgi:hypothetical protein